MWVPVAASAPGRPPAPGSALFRGGRRVRREGAAGRLPGAFGGIRYFPSLVLRAHTSSFPRAQETWGGWIGGGAGYPVSGGERSGRFGTTEKRYNYATGYKLTLCTTESYWIFVMCSFPNRCSLWIERECLFTLKYLAQWVESEAWKKWLLFSHCLCAAVSSEQHVPRSSHIPASNLPDGPPQDYKKKRMACHLIQPKP